MHDYGAGVTSIENLELGAISFDTNAGKLSWIDLPVTSSAAAGTAEAYSAQIDGNELFTIYAQSDGAGSIKNVRTVVGTSTDALFGIHKHSVRLVHCCGRRALRGRRRHGGL